MKLLKCRLLFIGIPLLILAGGTVPGDGGGVQAEVAIPTVTGLDFDKVEFVLWTQHEYHDQLYARAIEQFRKAGLYSRTDGTETHQDKIATLTLALDVTPLDETSPAKFMYKKKLELREEVIPTRNPKVHFSAVTWSLASQEPISTDRVTLEQLKDDLDQMLYQFILAYKMGNPSKNNNKK